MYNREHAPRFRWLHESFCPNWRLTRMQSAIGRIKLAKLPEWTRIRWLHAALLTEGFANIPGLRVTVPPDHIGHAYYKYYAFVQQEMLRDGWDRNLIMNAVAADGVPCFSGSCSEIYLEKAFEGMRPDHRLPVARGLGETSLMFLVHPTLTEKDMADTVAAVRRGMLQAAREKP